MAPICHLSPCELSTKFWVWKLPWLTPPTSIDQDSETHEQHLNKMRGLNYIRANSLMSYLTKTKGDFIYKRSRAKVCCTHISAFCPLAWQQTRSRRCIDHGGLPRISTSNHTIQKNYCASAYRCLDDRTIAKGEASPGTQG
eukprot:2435336-Pleurochrysis_carterae.AAC.2